MLASRFIFPAVLALLVALGVSWFIDQNEADQPNAAEANQNEPDLYMRNATITQFTSSGNRQHRINADLFTHFPQTDITTLKAPDMTLYGSQESAEPWDIVSEHGRLLPSAGPREETVELWDDVLAIQTDFEGNFINIRTESLTIHPETDYAETNEKVIIDDNSGRTTAAGMKAYFEEGKFLFFSRGDNRVKTILLPEFHKRAD